MTCSGPLTDGIVIDLSRALAGPHAATTLGDLGARVIKVESPGAGDDARGWADVPERSVRGGADEGRGSDRRPPGRHPCPHGPYPPANGLVQIAVGSEGLWRRFAPAFGLDPAGWASNPERGAAVHATFGPLRSAVLLARLAELGVPAGTVRNLGEVCPWEHTRSQGLLIEVDHAPLGPITLPGPALRLGEAEGVGVRTTHSAPPTLDQHGADISTWPARPGR